MQSVFILLDLSERASAEVTFISLGFMAAKFNWWSKSDHAAQRWKLMGLEAKKAAKLITVPLKLKRVQEVVGDLIHNTVFAVFHQQK